MGSLFGGGSSSPPKLPPAPPPAHPPIYANPATATAGNARQKAAAAAYGGTIATGPAGLTQPASTAQTSLLGG